MSIRTLQEITCDECGMGETCEVRGRSYPVGWENTRDNGAFGGVWVDRCPGCIAKATPQPVMLTGEELALVIESLRWRTRNRSASTLADRLTQPQETP